VNPLCNDQLTRIKNPSYGSTWEVPKVYRVGDQGMRGSRPYTVKAFAVNSYGLKRIVRDGAGTSSVWMCVKMRGWRDHAWLPLLIGHADSFQEKLVLGGCHPNPVFDHHWPEGWAQPDFKALAQARKGSLV
jgi:hypothetical protein